MNNECCFFSRGEVLISHSLNESGYGNNWGMYYGGLNQSFPRRYTSIGNVSTLSLNIASDFIAKNSYQGKIFNSPECAGVVINDIGFNLEMTCFSYENLSKALFGTLTNKSSMGTVDAQIIHGEGSIECGAFFNFQNLNPNEGTVVLKVVDSDLNDVSILVENTDFKVQGDGITLLEPLVIGTGNLLQLTYDYTEDSTIIEAFKSDIGPRSILFRGGR